MPSSPRARTRRSIDRGDWSRSSIAATPYAAQRTGHPAKRVFQALRIEVNRELSVLESAIPAALGILPVGGRIVVLAYQSLEDRIVKREFARAAASTAPSGLPVELPEHAPRFRLLVKGAELAADEERATNPRATPVRLRAAERLREARMSATATTARAAAPSPRRAAEPRRTLRARRGTGPPTPAAPALRRSSRCSVPSRSALRR